MILTFSREETRADRKQLDILIDLEFNLPEQVNYISIESGLIRRLVELDKKALHH